MPSTAATDLATQDQMRDLLDLRGRVSRDRLQTALPAWQQAARNLDAIVKDYNANCLRPMYKTDIEQAWVSPHLKRNRARAPLFACYQETFDSLVNFLETMDTFHDQFAALDASWREAFFARLGTLVAAHRRLAEAADLRVERPPLPAPPLHMEELRHLIEDLPASNVFTSVYLGHLTGYGILLCRLSDERCVFLAVGPGGLARWDVVNRGQADLAARWSFRFLKGHITPLDSPARRPLQVQFDDGVRCFCRRAV